MVIMDLGKTRGEKDQFILLAMICLCAGILAADVLLPLGFIIWILYLVPLLMSVWLSYRYSSFFTAWLVSFAILLGSFISSPARETPLDLPNRAAFIILVAFIALLVWEIRTNSENLESEVEQRRRVQEQLEDLAWSLERKVGERTGELSIVNEKLKADIAKRRKVETALAMANQKLVLLSGITRHDILNRVTALMLEIDYSKEFARGSQMEKNLDIMERAAESIRQQIAFTKDYQDIGAMAPQWHNAASLVRNAAAQIDTKGVQVDAMLDGIEICADPLIPKVFYNLIDNALQHGGHVSRIAFSYRHSTPNLVIICEDDGAGIAPEMKSRLFVKGSGRHSGLGLFLSREILTITGITIAETGEPGKGARFEITLPEGEFRVVRAT
jgi:signal transduction histidine kinase